jgi:predicted TPR repeat methyltransferase
MTSINKKPTAEHVNKLLATGQTQEALALSRQICETPGATSQEWLLYGSINAGIADYATATSALEEATRLDPDAAEARIGLGKVLATIGKYPEAIEQLLKAAQLQPDNPDVWLTLAITSGLAQDIANAEKYCRRSLELQPGSAEAHFNLANALQAQGKMSDAETEYETALDINPAMGSGWSMLAQARISLRKFEEAEDAATRALTLNPNMGEAHFTLGNISDALGDHERARIHFSEATRLLPGLPDAHMRLGEILYLLKDFANSAESFQTVVNLAPNHIDAFYLMGLCFQERKMYGRAEGCFRRVLAQNNDHLQARYCLAFLCAKMGRKEETIKHYEEVLRIDPDDEQAKHLLAAQKGETTDTAPAAYVQMLFDEYADTFDEKLVNELGYKTPEHLYGMINKLELDPASQDVIDLGCGTGLCAPLFRPLARTMHGVDLSPGMIEKARERELYDTLEVGDIVSSLKSKTGAWDMALSSDVFVYIGDLQEIFEACSEALRPGGLFAFSVEVGDDADTFVLRNTGRYAHSSEYIRRLASETGFSELEHCSGLLRKDKGMVEINGHLFLFRKTANAA